MKKWLTLLLLIPSLSWGENHLPDDLGGLVLECQNIEDESLNESNFYGYSFKTEIIKTGDVRRLAEFGKKYLFRKANILVYSKNLKRIISQPNAVYRTNSIDVIMFMEADEGDSLNKYVFKIGTIDREHLSFHSRVVTFWSKTLSKDINIYGLQCKIFEGTEDDLIKIWDSKVSKKSNDEILEWYREKEKRNKI